MQGVEFINDLRHNYLTLPYEKAENVFALRMLTENIAEGFLRIELRRLNEQAFLYYDISGMQSMEVLFSERTLDRKAFQEFIWNLHEIIEQSRELFLEGNGICLEPSMLFWDMEQKRWEFIYIPERGSDEEAQKEREQLAEFLVMRIDYEDKELADTVYRFYEEICAGHICPESFLEKEYQREKEESTKEIFAGPETEAMGESEDYDEKEDEDQDNGIQTEEAGKKKGIKNILLILSAAAVLCTAFFSRYDPIVMIPGGAAVIILMAAFLCIRKKSQKAGGEIEEKEEEEHWIEEEEQENEITQEEPTAEKTVYMEIQREQERKLYGTGKFRQQKIVLHKLPYTIGKDRTLTDHTVSDSSVSRIHARFFMEAGKLCMQDLNSTNGTYHNGLRLRPNEKVVLEPEDEVGFGRVQFVYR